MEQLQRKTFIPRGINRSNPVSQPEDGHCHEIVNMRYKDNAWRRVKEKKSITLIAPTPDLRSFDLLKQHPLLDDNYFIGVKNEKLYQIDIDEEVESLMKDYTGQEIEDIAFFGYLMIVSTTNDKDIFKIDIENSYFAEMPNIPEGSHLIFDSGDTEQNIELEAKSAGSAAQIAKINMLLYEDKEHGKFEGHCFFRFAWRLWDNSLIHHSAIHYYHVGINDKMMSFSMEEDDPVRLREYRTAEPVVKYGFSADDLTALEQYKDVITGLVLFMSDPISTYVIKDDISGWVNEVDTYYRPAINPKIGDLLSDVKGFYKVHEISLQDLLELTSIENGLYIANIKVDAGNVHNIESNERLPLDNYTNHKIKGAVTYDYNSMLHLGNVKTILSDPKNIGKHAPFLGVLADKYSELVYGKEMEFNPHTFGEEYPDPSENVNLTVEGDKPLTTLSINDYNFLLDESESDPAGCYNPSTGVYTVKSGNDADYRIDFIASFDVEFKGLVIIEIKKNSVSEELFIFDTNGGLTYVELSHTLSLVELDEITIHGYFANNDGGGGYIIGGGLTTMSPYPTRLDISRVVELIETPINCNPIIEVELSTSEGTKVVTKEYEAAESFLKGITGYYDRTDDSKRLLFKEFITYPDIRAHKIRIILKNNEDEKYYLIKTFDLIQHPYLDFAYSKPMLRQFGNYYYMPQAALLPNLINQVVPATENRIINDKNRVQVSEINNPWIYPTINSYRIGTSSNDVIQLATMSEPMSVGQFGESPLMVFTSQGIFNLMQGQQGILYAAINRFNLDVLLQKDALVELGGAIVYATSKGLFVLAGSQREEISKAIEGSVAGIYGREDRWRLPNYERQGTKRDIFTYGYYYNAYAVNDGRKIAPLGWRVPSDDEWKNLELAVGMPPEELDLLGVRGESVGVGNKLKSVRVLGTHSEPCWHIDTGATDEYNFCVLPAGYKRDVIPYGLSAGFWTSTPQGSIPSQHSRRFSTNNGGITHEAYTTKFNGLSVRCIQDKQEGDVDGDTGFDFDNDDNIFNWVVIGDYRWMRENLRSKKFQSGETIPYVQGFEEWEDLLTPAMSSGDPDDDILIIIEDFVTNVHNIADYFSDTEFIEYMQDAMLAYDNKEMEIFTIKPDADYSYVYQLETKMWHKISESYSKLIRRADNSFEALGDDGLLYNLSEEETGGMRDAGLLTRPMLFTDSNLKKVERMVARFINENSGGDTTVNIYVSLDGWNFAWLAGVLVSKQKMDLSNLIIKRTHTSARYFMVSMGLTASERFELTGFDLDVLYRHQQKIR
jgi:uncharacterized protein (TIGR02145 family)